MLLCEERRATKTHSQNRFQNDANWAVAESPLPAHYLLYLVNPDACFAKMLIGTTTQDGNFPLLGWQSDNHWKYRGHLPLLRRMITQLCQTILSNEFLVTFYSLVNRDRTRTCNGQIGQLYIVAMIDVLYYFVPALMGISPASRSPCGPAPNRGQHDCVARTQRSNVEIISLKNCRINNDPWKMNYGSRYGSQSKELCSIFSLSEFINSLTMVVWPDLSSAFSQKKTPFNGLVNHTHDRHPHGGCEEYNWIRQNQTDPGSWEIWEDNNTTRPKSLSIHLPMYLFDTCWFFWYCNWPKHWEPMRHLPLLTPRVSLSTKKADIWWLAPAVSMRHEGLRPFVLKYHIQWSDPSASLHSFSWALRTGQQKLHYFEWSPPWHVCKSYSILCVKYAKTHRSKVCSPFCFRYVVFGETATSMVHLSSAWQRDKTLVNDAKSCQHSCWSDSNMAQPAYPPKQKPLRHTSTGRSCEFSQCSNTYHIYVHALSITAVLTAFRFAFLASEYPASTKCHKGLARPSTNASNKLAPKHILF